MLGICWNTWHKLRAIAVAVLVTSTVMSWSTITRADAVTDWNAIAVQALATAVPPRPGPVAFLDLAIVQAAVHDAVQAIDGRFEPYHTVILGATGSPDAAAARAAHDVLVNILPGQARLPRSTRLTMTTWPPTAWLRTTPEWAQVSWLPLVSSPCGLTRGAYRTHSRPGFIGGTDPGDWRPTPSNPPAGPPPSFAPMATPWLGAVPPFTLKSGD